MIGTRPGDGRSADRRGPDGGAGADLRVVAAGAAAWVGALVGLHLSGARLAAAAVGLAVAGLGLAVRAGDDRRRTVAALLGIVAVLAVLAGARVEAVSGGAVARLAEQRASAEVVLVVRSGPVLRQGRYGPFVVAEGNTLRVAAGETSRQTAVPVLVLGGVEWGSVPLGATVRVSGRLSPARSAEHAAVLEDGDDPEVVSPPHRVFRAADRVRAAVREAARAGPEHAADLVPALVTGDDQALDVAVVDDFRTAGLTHLTAVSGTNLTLVLGFVMLTARWVGVRGRGFLLVGGLGVVGFVLVARPEPSVVRAAAMGSIALLGFASGGRAAGMRALGFSVLVLLLLDPWWAVSAGFALSVLATAGILVLGPDLSEALRRWLPRGAAEAVAVPVAAQLACTPVVAALSGEVSLVAVVANLLVAPAVAPATVLGLLGGLVGLVAPAAGVALGWLACWSAQWIVTVGQAAAGLPLAAVPWPTGPVGLTVLVALTVVAALVAPAVLRGGRVPGALAALVVALALALLLAPGRITGWPPADWVVVMCDVGQGDALAIRTGPEEALVVDAGPDPAPVRRCLDDLGVRRVPAVVLTHFHSDHVAGLAGVLSGRTVGEVQITGLAEPSQGVAQVRRCAGAAGVPVRVAAYGEVASAGRARWRVLGPRRPFPGRPNDSSLVLLLEVDGLRVLLTGDVEPGAQAQLRGEEIGAVDVLKVPHHGSPEQDTALLTGLGPRVALVSVGAGNDYGHPDPDLLDLLAQGGAAVRRSDLDGEVAVVARGQRLTLVSRRHRR